MKVLILGAGLSGLSVAAGLKRDYEIVEKDDACGGLCRSSRVNGFTFDRAGHVLHFKDESNIRLADSLLGCNIVRHKRRSLVCAGRDLFIPYPFQHNFLKMPPEIARECLDGLKEARRKTRAGHYLRSRSFKSWVLETFGQGIAKHFMVPYNEKFWLYPLGTLSAQWARGLVPVPRLKDLKGAGAAENVGYNAWFWYPRSGGMQAIVRSLEKRVKRVRTGWRPRSIDLDKKEVFFSNGRGMRFDRLVSTIPLPELCKIIRPLPAEVAKAASKLRYISVFNINLGISGKINTDAHWIYFAQKDIGFYRMCVPTNIAGSLAPSGCSSLCFEFSYSKDNPIDKNRAIDGIFSGLEKAGLPIEPRNVLVTDIQDIKCGYCVYDRHREAALKIISGYLEKKNVFLAGRYGRWQYSSMEDCMAEAANIAKVAST
ncbi:MAG TPA: hypothetical protein DCL35_03220 [Candidatus Omnitrophica bacterium]|nr:hypothetical protein [Candidatus Omnitrophota bacterium]